MTQYGFYFDPDRCIGCHACAVACNDKNNLPAGVHWRRVELLERGKYPLVRLLRLSKSCMHCGRPVCADVCPAGAISKRASNGVVVADRALCLGGDACARLCRAACPYDAPQFSSEPNPKMQKCDFCIDGLATGEDPACAAACPMLALDAGLLADLEAGRPTGLTTEGLPDPSITEPSFRIRAR